ncbi:MAG: DUF4177 domain-containing protein [Chthoniobacterales bacterium]
MNRHISSILLISFLLCLSSISAQTSAGPQKWEYKVIHLNEIGGTNQAYASASPDVFAEGLNAFGREGWQLVSIDTLQGQKIAIFKRLAAK